MEMKTINDLDDFALFGIFDYLDVKNILKCSLVCKRWYRVTGCHMKTMRKIRLIPEKPDQMCFEESWMKKFVRLRNVVGTLRKYHSIKIDIFSEVELLSDEELNELSSFFGNIVHVDLTRLIFKCETYDQKLRNLRKNELISDDEYYDAMESIESSSSSIYDDPPDYVMFIRFLSYFPSLKTLDLGSVIVKDMRHKLKYFDHYGIPELQEIHDLLVYYPKDDMEHQRSKIIRILTEKFTVREPIEGIDDIKPMRCERLTIRQPERCKGKIWPWTDPLTQYHLEIITVLHDSRKFQFDTIEIGDLHFSNYDRDLHILDYVKIFDFLSTQEHLTKLSFTSSPFNDSSYLSKQYYESLHNLMLAPRWNGQNFYSLHNDRLKELNIVAAYIPEKTILEIARTMKCEKLGLCVLKNGDNYDVQLNNQVSVTPNHYLKHLRVEHTMDETTLEKLFKLFPSIKSLYLSDKSAFRGFLSYHPILPKLCVFKIKCFDHKSEEFYLRVLEKYPDLNKLILLTTESVENVLETVIEFSDGCLKNLEKLCIASTCDYGSNYNSPAMKDITAMVEKIKNAASFSCSIYTPLKNRKIRGLKHSYRIRNGKKIHVKSLSYENMMNEFEFDYFLDSVILKLNKCLIVDIVRS